MAPRKLKCWPRKICERVCNTVILRKLAKATLNIYVVKWNYMMLCCVNASPYLHTNTLFPHIDIARNPRKCGESFAKAEVPKPSPSPHKLLPSGQVDESSPTCLIFGPWMKGCDSFIKWQGLPRKLAKDVFVKFIPAKENMCSRKSGERFWRKTMWFIEQNHTGFSTPLRLEIPPREAPSPLLDLVVDW